MAHFYALWRTRNGQQFWDGPFPANAAARRFLDTRAADTSGGSLVTTGIPMTPGERLEALPILDQDASETEVTATSQSWDYRPHQFRTQGGNKVYCATCGGTRAGVPHTGEGTS